MSEQNQTVLDVSPVRNLRGFYRLCLGGAMASALVCLIFVVLLVGNYFTPYSLSRVDKVLASQASENVAGKVGASADDFVLDGPQSEKQDNKETTQEIERRSLAERFPFAFLTMPTEQKDFLDLREKLLANPNDTELQAKVRAADLILRQQYFLKRARARTGAFLFLCSLAAGLLFASTASVIKRRLPCVVVNQECEHHREMNERQERLKAVACLGVVGGLGVGLVLGLLLSGRSELESFLDGRIVSAPIVDSPLTQTQEPSNRASSMVSDDPKPAGDSPSSQKTPSDDSPSGASQAVVEELRVDPVKDKEKFLELWNRNWGTFRGPLASGIENEKYLNGQNNQSGNDYVASWDMKSGENIVWKSPIPLEGHNSPVIWGERIFLTGASESQRKIFCFHLTTGKLLWETLIPDVGKKIGADSLNEDTGLAASTVVTDGWRVYAIFPNADIAAVDFSGKVVWSKNLGHAESQYGYASSLALWFDRVIVQIDVESDDAAQQGARLLALATEDGKELWNTARKDAFSSWASPVVCRVKGVWQIVAMGDPYLAAYDPQTGKELWRYTGFKTDVAVTPVAVDSVVYAAHTFPHLAAIDPTGRGELAKTPKTLWTAESSGLPNACAPVPVAGGIILLSENGSLTGIDLKQKKTVWELFVDEEDTFYASPVYTGKYLYLFAKTQENPHAYVIEPAKVDPKTIPEDAIDLKEVKGALVKKIPLVQSVSASPALKGGMMYVRDKNTLWCIGSGNASSK